MIQTNLPPSAMEQGEGWSEFCLPFPLTGPVSHATPERQRGAARPDQATSEASTRRQVSRSIGMPSMLLRGVMKIPPGV